MKYSISIQAGGQSSRMGTNKALVLFREQPMIQRIVERVSKLSENIFITTTSPNVYQFLSVPVFKDIIQGKGALGGLLTALHYCAEELVFVMACDMPFVNSKLILAEIDLLVKGGYDVVIPKTDLGYEPLHAVYRKVTCLPAVRDAINAKERKLISWLPEVKVREMVEEEIIEYDPGLLSFLNVNTPEEFRLAESFDETD